MAQIIKMDLGGTQPTVASTQIKPNRSVKWDGQEVDVTNPQFDKDFREILNSRNINPEIGDRVMYYYNQILNGTGDISGEYTSGKWTGLYAGDEQIQNKLANPRGGTRRKFRNDRQALYELQEAMKEYTGRKPKETIIKNDFSWDKNWNYNWVASDDGNTYSAPDVPAVSQMRNLLTGLKNFSNITKDNYYNSNSALDYSAASDWYQRHGQEIDSLIEKLNNGTLTKQDTQTLDFWRNLQTGSSNGTNNGVVTADGKTPEQKAAEKEYTNRGFDPKVTGNYINIDKNKGVTITDAMRDVLNGYNLNRNGYLFNNNWRNSRYWNSDFDWLYGKAIVNGKVYNISDLEDQNSEFYKLAHVNDGFYDRNAADNFTGANELYEYSWDHPMEMTTYNPKTEYHPYLDTLGDSKYLRYRSLNGIQKNLQNGQEALMYWNGSTARDSYGLPTTVKYVTLDDKGNVVSESETAPEFDPRGEQTGLSMYQVIDDNDAYRGMVAAPLIAGNTQYGTIYYNPRSKYGESSVILNFNRFKNDAVFKANGISGNSIRLPDRLAYAILHNKDNFNRLLSSDPQLQNRFLNTLGAYVGQLVGQRLTKEDVQNLFGNLPENMSAEDLYDYILGFVNSKETDAMRRDRWLVSPYTPAQQIESHQPGGIIGKAAKPKYKDSKIESSNEYRDPEKPGRISDLNNGSSSSMLRNLSAADWATLASAAMDLGAAAFGASGGSPASAGVGVASTLTQFGADWARDGLDWGDVGNLGLGLGLDALAFVPFAGGWAETSKAVRKLKNLSTVLMPVLALSAGEGAVTSFKNLLNGEFNTQDVKNVASALLMLKGIKNTRKYVKNTEYTPERVANSSKVAPEMVAKRKQAAVDDWLKTHPENKKLPNGEYAKEWVDDAGNVSDYEKAFDALSQHVSGFSSSSKAKLANAAQTSTSAVGKAKDWASNTWNGKYNPLGEGWFLDPNNRSLKTDFNVRTNKPSKKSIRRTVELTNPADTYTENVTKAINILDPNFKVNQTLIGDIPKYGTSTIIYDLNGQKKFSIFNNRADIIVDHYGRSPIDEYGWLGRILGTGVSRVTFGQGGKLPDLSIVSSMLDSYKKGGIIKAQPGAKAPSKDKSMTKSGTPTTPSTNGLSNSDINNAIDLVKLSTELGLINKSNKIALNGVEQAKNYIRSQQAPVINKENLNLNPIHRGAEMQRDNLNKARVIGSDSRVNNAQQLAIQDRVNEITDKENYAVSNAIAQNDAMNRKIDSANASARTQLNNQVALRLADAAGSEAQWKNAGLAQKNKALQSYLIGLQTRIDKDQMTQASMRDVVAKMNAQQQRKTAIYSKWGKEWADLSKEDKEKYGDDIDKYAQTKYPNEYSNIYTKSIYDYYNNSRPRNNSRLTVQDFQNLGLSTIPDQVSTEPEVKKVKFGITSNKNGSKMRPVSDQLILDTNKEAAKVINKLSDNAVKFLLKAIK